MSPRKAQDSDEGTLIIKPQVLCICDVMKCWHNWQRDHTYIVQ